MTTAAAGALIALGAGYLWGKSQLPDQTTAIETHRRRSQAMTVRFEEDCNSRFLNYFQEKSKKYDSIGNELMQIHEILLPSHEIRPTSPEALVEDIAQYIRAHRGLFQAHALAPPRSARAVGEVRADD